MKKYKSLNLIEGAEVVGLVMQTMDYDKFKMHEKNRIIKPENLKKIKDSMEIKNLFNPILVNEKFEIIDGNHRYKSCRELHLPILFIVVEGYEVPEMQILNLNKSNWCHEDYLTLYIKENIICYKQFKVFKDEYNLNFSDLIHIIDTLSGAYQGEKQSFILFDEGKLIINKCDKVIDFLDELSLFDKYDFGRHTSFVRAFLKLYTEDFYDKEYLRKMVDIKGGNLKIAGRKSTILEYAKYIAKELYSSPQRNISIIYDEYSESYHILSNKKGRIKKVG